MSKVIDASDKFKKKEPPKLLTEQPKQINANNSYDRFWYLNSDLDTLIKKKEKDEIRQVLFNLSQSIPIQSLFDMKEQGMNLDQILSLFVKS
jgi:hypothetical protein